MRQGASKRDDASKCAGESAPNSLGEEDEGDYKIDFAQRLELASADWFCASRVVSVPRLFVAHDKNDFNVVAPKRPQRELVCRDVAYRAEPS